jgi:glycosyltransferase involved in cell wall biosynthesis
MSLGHRDDAPDLLAAADVVVLPSRREGLPGTLIEAMFLEAPIVASDIPPVREVVGPDTPAALVPVGDRRALADAIVGILTGSIHPDVAAARRWALHHLTLEASATAMSAFYERATTS